MSSSEDPVKLSDTMQIHSREEKPTLQFNSNSLRLIKCPYFINRPCHLLFVVFWTILGTSLVDLLTSFTSRTNTNCEGKSLCTVKGGVRRSFVPSEHLATCRMNLEPGLHKITSSFSCVFWCVFVCVLLLFWCCCFGVFGGLHHQGRKRFKENSWQWAMHACLFSNPLQGKYFSGLSSQQRGL